MKGIGSSFHAVLIGLMLAMASDSFAQPIAIETNGYDQHEAAIAVDPTNSQHLIAVWNDFRSGLYNPGFGFSTNGGTTWDTGILTPSQTYVYGFDPSCGFDGSGNAYYAYIAHVSDPDVRLGPVYISKTTNNGSNWVSAQVSAVDTDQDKPYMAVDNSGGTYNGRVYVSWTDFSSSADDISRIRLAYSSNAGTTWTSVTVATQGGVLAKPLSVETAALSPEVVADLSTSGPFVTGSVPAVGPNGHLYVAFLRVDSTRSDRDWSSGTIEVARSTNGGSSFGSLTTVSSITVVWKHRIGSTLRASSDPALAIDPTTGNLVIAYTQYENGDLNVYSARSTDGGATWSSPARATESATNYQFFPWLTASSTGVVSLVFYQGTETSIDTYVAQSFNGGQSYYSPNVRITATSMSPFAVVSTWGSDYIGIASTGASSVTPIWADFHAGNADIYMSKTDPWGGPPSTPQQPQLSSNSGQYGHIRFSWASNTEPDLWGYEVSRKISEEGDVWAVLTVTSNTYIVDPEYLYCPGGGDYHAAYRVRAIDSQSLYSSYSDEVSTRAEYFRKPIAGFNQSPKEYALEQNYPNPFNPSTLIKYSLLEAGRVSLRVYDLLGREIAALADAYQESGAHTVAWKPIGSGVQGSSGVYIARLTVTDNLGIVRYAKSIRLLLMK